MYECFQYYISGTGNKQESWLKILQTENIKRMKTEPYFGVTPADWNLVNMGRQSENF